MDAPAALPVHAASVAPVSCPRPSAPPSLVSVLHRHALESILGFSALRKLPELMRVCSAFRSAIVSMAPLQQPKANPDVGAMCNSPLIVHVGTLRFGAFSPQSLTLLAAKAVHLRSLQCSVGGLLGADDPLVLPSKLRYLELSLNAAPSAMINRFVFAAGSLSSLGELRLSLPALTDVDFAPLTRLQSLHALRIGLLSTFEAVSMSPQQHAALRGLSPSLTALHVDPGLTEECVRQLFAAGHSFRIKDLGHSVLHLPVTAEIGELIGSVPLERLSVWPKQKAVATLELLPRLAPTLRLLQMQLSECTADPAAIVAALSHLTGLTSLMLVESVLTSAHLASMVRSLPQLRELTLNKMRALQSLAFLSEAGAPKLDTFGLYNCNHALFSPAELQHLSRAQPQLTSLSVMGSFNAWTDALIRSQFTLPSIVFPLLTHVDLE